MEYLILVKKEENEDIKKFNKLREWFFKNYERNNNVKLNFVNLDNLKSLFVKNKELYIISENTFPLLSSRSLETLLKNEKKNKIQSIGSNFIANMVNDDKNNINDTNFREKLLKLEKHKIKILSDFNKNNFNSSNWHCVNDKEIPNFLKYLKDSYFTWNNLNVIKLKNAKKFPEVIKYDGKNKLEGKNIASEMGINIPQTYFTFNNPEEITEDNLKKYYQFIIKPSHLDSGELVYKNTPNHKLTLDFIKTKFKNFHKKSIGKELNPLIKSKYGPKIIMEEFITGSTPGKTPLELKFYIFNGRIQFILLINKNIKDDGFDFYDENFKKFSNHILSQKGTSINAKIFEIKYFPKLKSDVLKLYEKFSDELGKLYFGRFMRIDFFVTRENYYFGEFALFPNGGRGQNLNENGKVKFVNWWLPEVIDILNGNFKEEVMKDETSLDKLTNMVDNIFVNIKKEVSKTIIGSIFS